MLSFSERVGIFCHHRSTLNFLILKRTFALRGGLWWGLIFLFYSILSLCLFLVTCLLTYKILSCQNSETNALEQLSVPLLSLIQKVFVISDITFILKPCKEFTCLDFHAIFSLSLICSMTSERKAQVYNLDSSMSVMPSLWGNWIIYPIKYFCEC